MRDPWNPMAFSDKNYERENLIVLARGIYSEFQKVYKDIGLPVPSPSEVFVELYNLAESFGVTGKDLDNVISVCFDKVPLWVRPILESIIIPPLPKVEDKTQLAPVEETAASVLPLSLPTAMPQLATFTPAIAPNTVATNGNSGQDKIEARDPAYEITQNLIKYVSIKILGEVIYSYTGQYYAYMSSENLRRLIMHICRNEVAKEGNVRLVNEIFKLLLCEPAICDHVENIAAHQVSFINGVLDLNNGQLYPHDPRYNTYYALNSNYTQSEYHPVFDQFLSSITNGDLNLCKRILEVIGYCLVPDNAAKAFFVFQGVSDSGKTILASFIRRCMNPDATIAIDIQSLGEHFMAATLIGRQLCTSMDIPAAPLSARSISTFKMATGGDPITTDLKYKSAVTFMNRARFILGTNHPLLTQHDDPAFYRRAVVVPFCVSVPRHLQDRNLLDKLELERDAIIFSALQAYYALRARNYVFSGDYQLNEFFYSGIGQSQQFSESKILRDFVQRNFIADPAGAVFVQKAEELLTHETGLIIPSNAFTNKFLAACHDVGLTGAKSIQKSRMVPGGNPQARIGGINFAENSQ